MQKEHNSVLTVFEYTLEAYLDYVCNLSAGSLRISHWIYLFPGKEKWFPEIVNVMIEIWSFIANFTFYYHCPLCLHSGILPQVPIYC